MSTDLTPGAYQPADVTLWGVKFRTVPLTRSVIKQSDDLQDQIIAAADNDAAVALIAERIDLRLKPVVRSKAPGTKVSTLIKEKWEEEILLLDDLMALVERIEGVDRPT